MENISGHSPKPIGAKNYPISIPQSIPTLGGLDYYPSVYDEALAAIKDMHRKLFNHICLAISPIIAFIAFRGPCVVRYARLYFWTLILTTTMPQIIPDIHGFLQTLRVSELV